jgi:serine protease Do
MNKHLPVLLFALSIAPGFGARQEKSGAQAVCTASIPDIYERVSPSVVAIRASSINPYDPEHRVERVTGSGVIIDSAGLVLTNSHVVFGRSVILVTLDDGTTLPAQPVGADPIFDIALIRIPSPSEGTLPSAELGDSDRILSGDDVYAIGNPLGLNQTLTRGIVSAVNRMLPGSAWSLTEPLIQTDAAINPGNSGGPLVDRCGKVIGITTAMLPEAQNIGFAIPSNLIKGVAAKLVADGRLVRPWLGVQGQFVPAMLKELLRIPLTEGFLIESVEPGSPAEKAGLRDGDFELTVGGDPILLGGDIITGLNGSKLDDQGKLQKLLSELKVGDKIRLAIFRENKTIEVDAQIVERPLMPSDIRRGNSSTVSPAGARQGPALRRRVAAF